MFIRISLFREMNNSAEESIHSLVHSVERAVDAFRKGEFVVVVDALDRENEGDLILAAEYATKEKLAFMIRYSSGLICAPISKERFEQLQLPMMVPDSANTESHGTAYTVSVDVKENTTTGISASDRALTLKALADVSKTLDSFNMPGHMFPLVAKTGGVKERPGHTEASLELCLLAGLYPAAAISEIVKDDGDMARLPYLLSFCEQFKLSLISIEQIILYKKLKDL